MIKNILLVLLVALLPIEAYANSRVVEKKPSLTHLVSQHANIDIKTGKVARIFYPIDVDSFKIFERDMIATATIPGDRIILINSPGGSVDVGERMLNLMRKEQKSGTKVICVVTGNAYSMAFNFLTHCDVRLAVPNALLLAHKIQISGLPSRYTAKTLRKMADELDKDDEPYRAANSKAMNLTGEQYETYTELETYWRADTLLNMGYLHGIAKFKK